MCYYCRGYSILAYLLGLYKAVGYSDSGAAMGGEETQKPRSLNTLEE